MSESKVAGYDCVEVGPQKKWLETLVTTHPVFGEVHGKLFLKEDLKLTGMEISVNSLPPGKGVPFVHSHKQNEEVYLFLSGTGEMLLDGELLPVQAGSVVRLNPLVKRSWHNTGEEPLTCVVIQAKAGSLEQWTRTDGIIEGPNPWPESEALWK